MSSVRHLLAAAALGTATVIAGPAVAQATPQPDGIQAGLKITHIVCHEQEDFTGADDAYLVQDGKVIWGPVQMTTGDSKDIQDVPVTQDRVLTLMEGDSPDDDDNLGSKRITGAGDYQFTDDGANYTVTIANQ